MVAVQAGSPVLIVGDLGARLELELASHGLSCAVVQSANDAVARMKTTRFPFVVVPPNLVDMGGVDFIHGVLRHFDANVVLYGNGIEASEINALLRTGRVAHFPAHAEGHVVADFLARRSNGSGPPAAATPLPTPAPRPTAPQFNLTPGVPPSPPPAASQAPSPTPSAAASALSNALFGAGTPGALSSAQTQFPSPPQTGSGFAFPTSSFPPSPAPGFAATPSGGFPSLGTPAPRAPPYPAGAIGSLPPLGPPPGAAPGPQFEQMVDDLARTNAELVVWKNKLAALEQEKAALLVEVEAARRSAMADVAQVMALSDEGDPVAEELEELRTALTSAKAEYAMARAEADTLRGERERLAVDAAKKAQQAAEERARADAAEAELADVQRTTAESMSELEGLRLEQERSNAEIAAARAELDTVKIERNTIMHELEVMRGERDMARADVDAAQQERDELRASLDEVKQAADGKSVEEAALRTELEKVRGDVAAARNDATTVRLDLQEALMRLDEATTAMQALQEERDALRAEAGPLREWATQVVALHAQQQTELERLRRAIEGSGAADTLRKLTDLVRALEPFTWGLTQATGFYAKAAVGGGESHLKLLQQLQGVLLRLRDEIAMLDL